MNPIIAIDPGTTESAIVIFDPVTRSVKAAKEENSNLADRLSDMQANYSAFDDSVLAVEMIACYGMPVGREVFETCVWVGRFIEAWGGEHQKIYRKDVKMHLCSSMRAKDSNIRQALIDLFGGSKRAAIGLKASPGPLYGFSGDMWAALAVAVTYAAAPGGNNNQRGNNS